MPCAARGRRDRPSHKAWSHRLLCVIAEKLATELGAGLVTRGQCERAKERGVVGYTGSIGSIIQYWEGCHVDPFVIAIRSLQL